MSPISVARESVEVVGSSTVYPFSTVVAERYGRSTGNPTPKIESTGSGGGMKLFCSGVGTNHPDITNSSRRIKMSEFKKCQSNGVKDIIEIQVGIDGLALAPLLVLSAAPLLLRRALVRSLQFQLESFSGYRGDAPFPVLLGIRARRDSGVCTFAFASLRLLAVLPLFRFLPLLVSPGARLFARVFL